MYVALEHTVFAPNLTFVPPSLAKRLRMQNATLDPSGMWLGAGDESASFKLLLPFGSVIWRHNECLTQEHGASLHTVPRPVTDNVSPHEKIGKSAPRVFIKGRPGVGRLGDKNEPVLPWRWG